MRTTTLVLVTTFFTMLTLPIQLANAQEKKNHFEVETEPVSYIMNGAGITGTYLSGQWTYSIEVYGIEIPESMHGNDEFDASLQGLEFQTERFFSGNDGFFVGSEVGVTNLEVTHSPSDETKDRINYSVGIRGGYRWYTGLGDLYLSPVTGLGYSLNGEDIQIKNATFESGAASPWATVGIGWTF